LRLVITAKEKDAVSALASLAACLAREGIDIEFSDLTRLVLIPSLWQEENEWDSLLQAIRGWAVKTRPDQAWSRSLLEYEKIWRSLFTPQETGLPLWQAVLEKRPKKLLPLSLSAGWIAAGTIAPYPPGLGLVWPGERISGEMVDFLSALAENSISISGVLAGQVYVFT
jgi:hypothetical protein